MSKYRHDVVMLFYDTKFFGPPKHGGYIWVRAVGRDRVDAQVGKRVKVATNDQTFIEGIVEQAMSQNIKIRVIEKEAT